MTPERLGQHFLADAGWRERIAQAIFLPPLVPPLPTGGLWIEIGAGHGEMTPFLARHAGRVIAIELDAKLLPRLREVASPLGNVSVVAGDILRLDLAKLAGHQSFRVYGNLPYYITSPIVHRLFEHADQLEGAFILVQLEVATRLTARPGVRDYGYLSACAQFYARPEILLRIPPGAFRPRPKVTSALVALRPPGERATLGVAGERDFLEFLKVCFAQKRKTLRNNLRAVPGSERTEQTLERLDISARVRAEQLTLEQFARLFASWSQERAGREC